MMNFKKLISLFLAVLMLCGALTSISVVTASAEEATTTAADSAAAGTAEADDEDARILKYHSTVFANPEEKLATMKLMSEKGRYAIYADQKSGEVAVKDTATGQVLFSNPYDLGASNATENVKNRLMSQIIVQFKEVESDNKKTYGSFEYAAIKDQIKVKNIKNGIRVEYTIGREEARMLVPRQIEKERFETLILAPMEEYYGIEAAVAEEIIANNDYENPLYSPAFYFRKQLSYFVYKSLDDCSSDRLKQDLLNAFPIVDKMNIYILEPSASTTEISRIEEIIKSACPNYSYEEMDYDHQLTEYTSEDENPPLFKMALEYTIDETGFTVRLPANGIRFNESKFELLSLQVLPYMGAGNNAYDGYAFFPDGSGALFAFEDMKEINNETITAKIYGEDYAYHKLDMEYQQVVRYPVYGIVENVRYYDCVYTNELTGEEERVTLNGVIYDAIQKAIEDETTAESEIYKKYGKYITQGDVTPRLEDRGFAASIEEGDALTSLSYVHEGTQAPYDTITVICNPRPRDEYNLADAISVADNKTVSVVCERKYVGSYKIHFTMLSDEKLAAKAEEDETIKAGDWYEASWLGMAMAYRDFLVSKGILTEPGSTVSDTDIPLYIESFGSMETIEKILSIPVEVKRPLTSAEDVLTMYSQLSTGANVDGELVEDEGGMPRPEIKNINFKLTGYANGGMYAKVPYGLKWEKAVSKELSMQELFDEAAAINEADDDRHLGLFPDFDFSYVTTLGMFDGFSMRKHAVRTIDDLYSYKREYMATRQKYAGYFQLAISPAYFSRFYTKLMENYLGYQNVTGISVGSLGTALNSDFDEDDPYNREDAKSFVVKALEFISGSNEGTLEVMVDGGNAYTWQYADHILGASLDSSRYIVASYSVPFLGVVLHGYKDFTGAPLNMEGDVNYAKLKAIENGASVYFTLSYQNTQNLKEDFYLSKYYSVRYDIWQDDVVEIYGELNEQLRDVQDMPIVDHEFLTGMRVPDTDELERDLKEEFDRVMGEQANQKALLEQQKKDAVADAREQITALGNEVKNRISTSLTNYRGQAGAAMKFVRSGKIFTETFADYMEVKLAYDATMAGSPSDDEKKAAQNELASAKEALTRSIKTVASKLTQIDTALNQIEELIAAAKEGRELINNTEGRPDNIVAEVDELIAEAEDACEVLMGTTLQYSAANLELQTFLHLHFAAVKYYTDVETDPFCDMENIYNIFAENAYGLYYEELEFLKFLPANQKRTDDQIIQRYGLKKGTPSMDGLALYVKDILGVEEKDGFRFDPALVATDTVDDSILVYFKNIFSASSKSAYKNVTATDDRGIFAQYFNANPERYSTMTGGMIPNTDIKVAFEAIAKVVTPLTDKIAEVKDGEYDITKLATETELNTMVDDIVKIIEQYRTSESKRIEFYDGDNQDAHKAHARNYIYTYYYFKVMDSLVASDADEDELAILTIESTTDASINLLVEHFLAYDADADALALYDNLLKEDRANEAAVDEAIGKLNDEIKAEYGDKTAELKAAYEYAYAVAASKIAKPALVGEKKEGTEKTINSAADLIIGDRLKNVEKLSDLDAIIADVVKLHDDYTLEDGYDKNAAAAAYVYYSYLVKYVEVTAETTAKFYYDDTLAYVDDAVMDRIAEKTAALKSELSDELAILAKTDAEDATKEEKAQLAEEKLIAQMTCLEAVFNSLADAKDPIEDFVDKLAAGVVYAPEKKGTIADDIMQHYCNMLFEELGVTKLGASSNLTLKVDKETSPGDGRKEAENYLKERIPELLKAAKAAAKGGETNYTLEAFMSTEEINRLADDVIQQRLIKNGYLKEDTDVETVRPAVINIIKHSFYAKVLDELEVEKAVDFNVYAVYGDSVEESAKRVRNIIDFHVLGFSNISESELNNLFRVAGGYVEEETEEEISRYLSDDGRIVSVTYGQKLAEGGYSKYKTFVLNYNNFSVNVVYDEITYTIPAYGYVVVMHDTAAN